MCALQAQFFNFLNLRCEAIVVNIIAPLALEELHEDLTKLSFVALSMDASNLKEMKIVLIAAVHGSIKNVTPAL